MCIFINYYFIKIRALVITYESVVFYFRKIFVAHLVKRFLEKRLTPINFPSYSKPAVKQSNTYTGTLHDILYVL